MTPWHNGAPQVGDVAEMQRTVTATDIERFTQISGDRNPLHYDLEAARASRFGEIVEYCFQVPANRWGAQSGFAAAHLKTIQEVITLAVFCGFSVLYLGEPLKWNHAVGFLFVAAGAALVFKA